MKRKLLVFNFSLLIILASMCSDKSFAQLSQPWQMTSQKSDVIKPIQSINEWREFGENASLKATTFFNDMKEALSLSVNDGMILLKTEKDEFGFTHYRFQQVYKNRKVIYGEYFLHGKVPELVNTANGRIIKGINAAQSASISEQAALQSALKFMNAKRYLWQNADLEKDLKRQLNSNTASYFPQGELVYAPANNEGTYNAADYKLAWQFKIYTEDPNIAAKVVYVDALTGKIIHHADISMNCAGATGGSSFNGNVSFSTELNGGSYRSHNDCQATDIYVYNCNGGVAANNFYTDADNSWTLASQQSGVQAQWGALMTYNYFIGQHSRASWDGASGDMIAYNNAFAGSNNACWGCTGNSAIFYAGSTAASTDDWNTNDIVGHEFTHGVIQSSANIVLTNEPGAINESISDIFGEMVESWSEGNCDFLVGADRGAIRSFINPSAFSDYGGPMPDTYLGTGWYTGAVDNGGVKHNSSVMNHWFYLLSEGGSGANDFGATYSVTGITRFKARLILYRALTVYMNTTTSFIDARKATLQAAFDLYGQCSPEIIAVGDAWHAVGVESQSAQFIKNICGSYPASGTFLQSISVLTAANGCATTITPSASTVYFAARDRIVLYPGFIAGSGSKFVAYLEPCSSTMWRTEPPKITMSEAEKKAIPGVAKN